MLQKKGLNISSFFCMQQVKIRVGTKWGKKRQSKKGRASKVQNGAKKGRATFEVIF